MRSDFPKDKARRFRTRRSTGDRVVEALLLLSNGKAQILTHEEKAWASITFSGTRHELMLDFDGTESVAAGETFIAALPDHEFSIPGQLVADATVSEASHTTLPEPRLVVTVVMLLLEDV